MKRYKKVDIYVGYLLIISSIFILIYNVIHYSPSLGYDAEAHFAYVKHIARSLPTCDFHALTKLRTS